jgi:hypothetical protein
VLLGLGTGQAARAGLQVAALLGQEALDQPVGRAAELEVQLDGG